jgi:hypothetical protein
VGAVFLGIAPGDASFFSKNREDAAIEDLKLQYIEDYDIRN